MKNGQRVIDRIWKVVRTGTVLDTQVKLSDGSYSVAVKWDSIDGMGEYITWGETNKDLEVIEESK